MVPASLGACIERHLGSRVFIVICLDDRDFLGDLLTTSCFEADVEATSREDFCIVDILYAASLEETYLSRVSGDRS